MKINIGIFRILQINDIQKYLGHLTDWLNGN